jgi:hypothetical protein
MKGVAHISFPGGGFIIALVPGFCPGLRPSAPGLPAACARGQQTDDSAHAVTGACS